MSGPPKLVYTTDPEEAKRLREEGRMPAAHDAPAEKQTIRVELDRKRRKGKTVTLATGFALTDASLQNVARKLKQRCGAGGTAKQTEIEIQGDHRELVAAELEKLGFRVRKIG